ncbi:hypothetical protein THOM_3132, partial [Trachipleistophora hominis]
VYDADSSFDDVYFARKSTDGYDEEEVLRYENEINRKDTREDVKRRKIEESYGTRT